MKFQGSKVSRFHGAAVAIALLCAECFAVQSNFILGVDTAGTVAVSASFHGGAVNFPTNLPPSFGGARLMTSNDLTAIAGLNSATPAGGQISGVFSNFLIVEHAIAWPQLDTNVQQAVSNALAGLGAPSWPQISSSNYQNAAQVAGAISSNAFPLASGNALPTWPQITASNYQTSVQVGCSITNLALTLAGGTMASNVSITLPPDSALNFGAGLFSLQLGSELSSFNVGANFGQLMDRYGDTTVLWWDSTLGPIIAGFGVPVDLSTGYNLPIDGIVDGTNILREVVMTTNIASTIMQGQIAAGELNGTNWLCVFPHARTNCIFFSAPAACHP